jgi:hypothetical protein
MTKKELEEKNKALREEIDKLHIKVAELEKEEVKSSGELNERAVGGFFDDKTRQWFLTVVKFNRDTGEAEVVEQTKTGNDFAMFSYNVNKFVAEQINLRYTRRVK